MEKLRSLLALIPTEWPRDSFILCGSAALAFRGVRDVHDLDILIRPELWPGLSHLRGVEREEAYEQAGRLLRLDSGVDVFDSHPRIGNVAGFDQTLRAADLFRTCDGMVYNVLSMRHTLAIKALAMVDGREKDLADMRSLAALIGVEEGQGLRSWALRSLELVRSSPV